MTYKELRNNRLSELKILNQANNYFAHVKDDHQNKEHLKEHIQLVEDYLLDIVEIHKLEFIIDNLIKGFFDKEKSNSILFSFIKTLFFQFFHIS